MADPPTPLHFPPTLPFPITITRFLVSPSQEISRGTPLVEYSFTSISTRQALTKSRREGKTALKDLQEWDMVASWESGTEGEVVKWATGIRAGSIIGAHQPRSARISPIL